MPDEKVGSGTVTAIPGDLEGSAPVLIRDHCGRTLNRVDQVFSAWSPLQERRTD